VKKNRNAVPGSKKNRNGIPVRSGPIQSLATSCTVVRRKHSSQVLGHAGKIWNYSTKQILFVTHYYDFYV